MNNWDTLLLGIFMVGLFAYLVFARKKTVSHRLLVSFLGTVAIPIIMTRGWIFWPVFDILQYAHGMGVFFIPSVTVIAVTEGFNHSKDRDALGDRDLFYCYIWFFAAMVLAGISVVLWATLFK